LPRSTIAASYTIKPWPPSDPAAADPTAALWASSYETQFALLLVAVERTVSTKKCI
jgi:hypothetical protein